MTNIKRYAVSFFLIIGLLFAVLLGSASTVYADETENAYTSVLDDLNLDSSFNAADYPDVTDDYSLDVIQIAESINGELFVYVYQPSHNNVDRVATSINISTGIDDDLYYRNYGLTLLSNSGVFDKYVVNDFKVLSSTERYYDIPCIFADYNKKLDGEAGADETNEKAFLVAQRWTASTVNGQVSYSMKGQEIIEILNPFVGFLRYSDGFYLLEQKYTESHFIAFTTDRKIDELMEAELTWQESDYEAEYTYTQSMSRESLNITYTNDRPGERTLYANETAEYKGDGWFAKEYSWRRIQTVDEFIKSEDLSDETLSTLQENNLQWVLRFTETEYKYWGNASQNFYVANYSGVRVTEVTILRLKFVTDCEPYNLGAVCDKITGDLKPDNKNTNELDFGFGGDRFNDLKRLLGLILGVIVIIFVLWIVVKIVNSISQKSTQRKVNEMYKQTKRKK